jgi:hypothetical protein
MSQVRRIIIQLLIVVVTLLVAYGLYRYGFTELALALVLLLVMSALYATGQRRLVYDIILRYVQEAENYWGSSTGKIKFQEVFAKVMQEVPWFIRILFSEADVATWIDKALLELKEELAKRKAVSLADGKLVKL